VAPVTVDPPSLTELVRRAQSGERAAWDLLVTRLERVVWKVTHTLDMKSSDREEAFQNTWLKLFQAINRVQDPERLPGWLATTARREALTILQQRTRVTPVDDFPVIPAALDEPDQRLIEHELADALRAAFGQLSSSCQRLLRLLTCDPPLTYAEVSVLLAVDHGYIGPTRGRCLDALRKMPALVPFTGGAR